MAVKQENIRLTRTGILVLVAGVVLSLALAWQSWLVQTRSVVSQLQREAHDVALSMEREFAQALRILETLISVRSVGGAWDRERFNRIVAPILAHDSALEAVDRALENLEGDGSAVEGLVTVAPLPEVSADRSLLTDVFQNLIGNALKFVADRPAAVEVEAEEKGRDIIVAVQDNGIGMDDEKRDRIFHPLQRLVGKTEFPGTGLGLAICRRIIEGHRGRL